MPVIWLLKREFYSEWRNLQGFLANFFLLGLLLVLSALCLADRSGNLPDYQVAGLYWLLLSFIILLLHTRSSRDEQEEGFYHAILLSGVAPEVFFIVKLLWQTSVNWLLGMVLGWLFAMIHHHSMNLLPQASMLLLLTSIGFAALGVFFSTMLRHQRRKTQLLPLIFYPLVLPLVIPAIHASEVLLSDPQGDLGGSVSLLLSGDLALIALGVLFFGTLLED